MRKISTQAETFGLQVRAADDLGEYSATCVKCHKSGLPLDLTCNRSSWIGPKGRNDNGADYKVQGLSDRYDATCLRCCDHNHG